MAFSTGAYNRARALWGRPGVDTTARDTMHFDIGFPPDVEPLTISTAGFAISPDGKAVAMVGVKDSVRRLFVRRFGSADTIEVPGSIGAQNVESSPDGASVALVPGSGSLTRLSLADQQRTVLTPGVDLTSGLAWSSAGIVFVREGALWVSAEGGAPRALTVLDAARHEVMHSRPIVLPGARLVLFASLTSDPGTERIEAVSFDSGRSWSNGRRPPCGRPPGICCLQEMGRCSRCHSTPTVQSFAARPSRSCVLARSKRSSPATVPDRRDP